ncbi:hypothetical protein BUE80_DR000831 [Diplocarpon rosae]|nr:hypothetical protein BUE80_DR000831 [Diplocarpon rosae]
MPSRAAPQLPGDEALCRVTTAAASQYQQPHDHVYDLNPPEQNHKNHHLRPHQPPDHHQKQRQQRQQQQQQHHHPHPHNPQAQAQSHPQQQPEHHQPNLILILHRSKTHTHVLDCREAASAAKMKAMKSINMNRVLGSIRRKPNTNADGNANTNINANAYANGDGNANTNTSAHSSTHRSNQPTDTSPELFLDPPEAVATRDVHLFCESGGPNGSGDEVLYLPTIVEACESSPSAAKEASYAIRKFLSKDNYARPYVQYNGVMLMRILADNPGKTFTRNMDVKFVQTIKELLRLGRDPSVKQILMETLDMFGREKAGDEGLQLLNSMWRKEQEKMAKVQQSAAGPRILNAPVFPQQPPLQQSPPPPPQSQPQPQQQLPPQRQEQQNYFSRSHNSRHLPAPYELSTRIEEARTSANLLSQVVQSTPPSELLTNELVREFADRCQSASRSVQAYMIAENPLGNGNGGPAPTTSFAPPPGPPPSRTHPARDLSPPLQPPRPAHNLPTPESQPSIPSPATPSSFDENPFSDPERHPPFPKDQPSVATGQFNDELGIEPYHPGFKETASYVGRQDSALGKVTMHAAVPEVDSEDEHAVTGKKQESIYRY